MGDWLASFDAQCKAEGLDVVEVSDSSTTNEKDQKLNSAESTGMNVADNRNDSTKPSYGGSFGGSKSVGGGFGAGRQMMNPPPQTSFGSTSTNRIGTGSVSPNTLTHDGRGPAIGSPDFENGGGNVISVGIHKTPACKPFSFASTNNARVTSTLKTSRFGDYAQNQQSNANKEMKVGSQIPRAGGGFGTPESFFSKKVTNIPETQTTMGGGFGSRVGGGFGSRQIVTEDKRVENIVRDHEETPKCDPVKIHTGVATKSSFELPIENGQKFTTGGSFGGNRNNTVSITQLPTNQKIEEKEAELVMNKTIETSRRIGGGFGKNNNLPHLTSIGGGSNSNPVPSSSANGNKLNDEANQTVNSKRPVGGGFGVRKQPVVSVQTASTPLDTCLTSSPHINMTPPNFTSNEKYPLDTEKQRSSLQLNFVAQNRKSSSNYLTSCNANDVRKKEFERTGSEQFVKQEKETIVNENVNYQNSFYEMNRSSTKSSSVGLEKENAGSFVPTAQPTFQQFSGGRGRGGGLQEFAGQGQQNMNQAGRGQFVSRGPSKSFQQSLNRPPFANNNGITNGQGVPRHELTKCVVNVDEAHDKATPPAEIALINKYLHREVKMMKNANVDIQRSDPTSPLYSIGSFKQLRLKPEVLTALDCLGFDFPTRIQETALPLLLMEPPSNLIAQAQSGTGKTAAFVLTMLCRIDMELKCPQCICIAPTLELAKQIGEVVTKMGQFIEGLDIHYAIKGANMAEMRNKVITAQIVIGTPATTRDYLIKYKCIDPSKIRCLVLDEADVMLYQQGFTDISTTIYNLIGEKSSNVQSMLFSATYDTPVLEFATKLVKNAIVVMLKKEEQALPNIKQFYVKCANRLSKFESIVNLYSGLTVASSVIFCYTKSSVVWLCENMRMRGHQADCLHGDMTVVERADIITRFKRNEFRVLITTSVLSRGIDVPQVSVVINYDLPVKYDMTNQEVMIDGQKQPDCETYLHRIGRTGRFGKMGIAINFVDDENTQNMIGLLENHFQMRIEKMDPSNLLELEEIEKSTYAH